MAVAEMSKTMTIEVPIRAVVDELKDLFETPRSVRLTRSELPGYAAKHSVAEMGPSTHIVYADGGLKSSVDLTPVGDLTTITIRIRHTSVDKKAAAMSMLAQLCAFEAFEQGYRTGLKNEKTRSGEIGSASPHAPPRTRS